MTSVKILSEKFSGQEVPCEWYVTGYMPKSLFGGPSSVVTGSQGFSTYKNTSFKNLPDGTYVFDIKMRIEVVDMTTHDSVTVRYEKKGESFETDWFSANFFSEQQIEEMNFNGGIGQIPESKSTCTIKKITSL